MIALIFDLKPLSEEKSQSKLRFVIAICTTRCSIFSRGSGDAKSAGPRVPSEHGATPPFPCWLCFWSAQVGALLRPLLPRVAARGAPLTRKTVFFAHEAIEKKMVVRFYHTNRCVDSYFRWKLFFLRTNHHGVMFF